MFYVFTESDEGKLGYVGSEYFSEVQAQDKADDYDCITHVQEGKNLVKAKQALRDKLVKNKKDIGILHKNIRNKV